MLPIAHLPLGVSTEDCLAWSSDGELAIAADEEVYLLLPRHQLGEPWTHIRFRVNTFTYDEWPLKPQTSFANMSIGEEQARVRVVSLAWSPPGLAKYRRSVLAVLTSNLLLSLWAPGVDPTDSEHWERVLVIDKTRIRSMAWAPTNRSSVDAQTPFSTRKWGTPLLAVGNDNEISFMNISSPFTSVSTPWSSHSLGHKAIPPVHKVNHRPSLLRDALNTKHFIDYIVFDHWTSAGVASLFYCSSNILYQAMLTVSNDPLQISLSDATSQQPIAQGTRGLPPKAPSFMQDSLEKYKKNYGSSNKLNSDDVILRTWGVAYMDDLIAVCITSHPARMVEYKAIFESSATVLFGSREGSNDTLAAFPWQETKKIDDGDACRRILLKTFDPQLLASLQLTALDLRIVYAAICATLFHRMSDQQRQPCLNSAESTLRLLEIRSSTTLQAEREAIATMKSSEMTDSEDLDRLLEQFVDDSNAPAAQLLSICPICEDGHVGLCGVRERFSEAYCPKRHPFSRCALTFLPILEPGCTKRCTVCKREFLSEEKLSLSLQKLVAEPSFEDQLDKPSLIKSLSEEFDTCPYCGGKYCG